MLNKIVAKTHQIQIKNSNFGRETNIHGPPLEIRKSAESHFERTWGLC